MKTFFCSTKHPFIINILIIKTILTVPCRGAVVLPEIIEARGIVKEYGGKYALRGVDLVIEEPMTYALLGPNGAGKTTLLTIILGIASPTSGTVRIMGRDPRDPGVRSRIGYVSQEYGLYELLNGWENALLYARLYGVPTGEARERILKLADKLGIKEALKRRVSSYSGGMKEKLSLIIGFIHDPEILVLDEPTTGMDPGSRRTVWELIMEEKRKGKTILLSTHYMEEADTLADRVGIIDSGKIIAEGSPEELKKKYGPRSVIEVGVEDGVNPEALKELESRVEKVLVSNDRLRVYVEDPDEYVPVVTTILYRYGVRIRRLIVEKPTLEDVLLRLTGRRLEG